MRLEPREERHLALLALLLPAPLDPLLDLPEIGQHQLALEGGDVLDGTRRGTGQIRKTPHHLDEGIGVPQRRHHLLIEHGALLGIACGREVDERHLGVGRLLRLVDAGEEVDPRIRHLDRAHGRTAVPGIGMQAGEGREHGRLAGAREAGETDLHAASAARCSPQIVLASTISPRRTIASASDRGTRAISAMTSSWSRATSACARPCATKRWMRSSVKPGVVKMAPRGASVCALSPASSRSSRAAHASGDSSGWSSTPAGSSQMKPPAACRNCRISTTHPASSRATTADAPLWRMISRSTSTPPGSVTRSTPRSTTRPAYTSRRMQSRHIGSRTGKKALPAIRRAAMNRRAQIALTPQEQREYLAQSHTIILVSNGRHGFPLPVPMWYLVEPDGAVAMTTFRKSQKSLDLRRDPRCTLLVESGRTYPELKGLIIRGRAELDDDTEHVLDVLEAVQRKYNPGIALEGLRDALRGQASKRCVIRVRPERVSSWDHAKLGAGVY